MRDFLGVYKVYYFIVEFCLHSHEFLAKERQNNIQNQKKPVNQNTICILSKLKVCYFFTKNLKKIVYYKKLVNLKTVVKFYDNNIILLKGFTTTKSIKIHIKN